MNKEWEMVKDFHTKFNTPVSDAPLEMDKDRARKRYNWMLEEIDEFLESENIYDQADAMIDLIYFALGTMVEMGLKPDGLFEIVHTANMSKLWEDGKPHYNEEGKVIKSPNWVDPYPLIKEYIDGASK